MIEVTITLQIRHTYKHYCSIDYTLLAQCLNRPHPYAQTETTLSAWFHHAKLAIPSKTAEREHYTQDTQICRIRISQDFVGSICLTDSDITGKLLASNYRVNCCVKSSCRKKFLIINTARPLEEGHLRR